MEEYSLKNLLLRYFLHGILFSAMGLAMLIIWAFILVVLIIFGSLIGVILGLIVEFFIVGGLNVFLTSIIWSVSVRSDWKSLLVHGFVLSVVQLIAHVPVLFVNAIVPGLATTIVLFIIYSFIDGFLARRVARLWTE